MAIRAMRCGAAVGGASTPAAQDTAKGRSTETKRSAVGQASQSSAAAIVEVAPTGRSRTRRHRSSERRTSARRAGLMKAHI